MEADAAHWSTVEEATELLQEERFHEALAVLRDVLKADPKNPYGYHFTGVALFEIGELEPARDAFKAALKLAPQHLGARVALANVLRQLGDLENAVKEGMIALTQAPGDADALHAIGLAHLSRGDARAARKYLEAFLAADPEFEAALEVRAILSEITPKKTES